MGQFDSLAEPASNKQAQKLNGKVSLVKEPQEPLLVHERITYEAKRAKDQLLKATTWGKEAADLAAKVPPLLPLPSHPQVPMD